MANRRPVVTDTVVTRKGASTGLQDLYKGFKKLAQTGVIQTKSLQSDVENNYIYFIATEKFIHLHVKFIISLLINNDALC